MHVTHRAVSYLRKCKLFLLCDKLKLDFFLYYFEGKLNENLYKILVDMNLYGKQENKYVECLYIYICVSVYI